MLDKRLLRKIFHLLLCNLSKIFHIFLPNILYLANLSRKFSSSKSILNFSKLLFAAYLQIINNIYFNSCCHIQYFQFLLSYTILFILVVIHIIDQPHSRMIGILISSHVIIVINYCFAVSQNFVITLLSFFALVCPSNG